MMNARSGTVLWVLSAVLLWGPAAYAAGGGYAAEVLSVDGKAYSYSTAGTKRGLADGDVLQEGESIETLEGATVELALDGDWKNTVTLTENTQLLIDKLYPTTLQMTRGDVYAKLDELPQGSSFEVRTPVLIAAVRGTRFQTHYAENDSQVFSFSESPVYVYGREKDGAQMKDPVILRERETTVAARRGDHPDIPYRMTSADARRADDMDAKIRRSMERAHKEGRHTKIAPLSQIKNGWQRREKLRQAAGTQAKPLEPSAAPQTSSIQSPRDRFFRAVDGATPKSQFEIEREKEEMIEGQKDLERRNLGKQSLGHGTAAPGSKRPGPSQPKVLSKPGAEGPGQPQDQPNKQQGPRRPPPPRGSQQKK